MRNLIAAILSLATVIGGIVLFDAAPLRPAPAAEPSPTAVVAGPTSSPPSVLRGTVRDENGAPIPLAAVTAGDAFALTSVSGTFEIAFPAEAPSHFRVSANRFVTAEPVAAEPGGDGVEVRLLSSPSSVLSAEAGPGMTTVALYDALTLAAVASMPANDSTAETFAAVPAGEYIVVARNNGGASVVRAVSVPAAAQPVVLAGESPTTAAPGRFTAVARVFDVAGNVVGSNADREVWVVAEGAAAATTATADDEGRATLEVSAGNLLRAFSWDRTSGFLAVSAPAAATHELTLTVGSGGPTTLPALHASPLATAPVVNGPCGWPDVRVVAPVSGDDATAPVLEHALRSVGIPVSGTATAMAGYVLSATTVAAPGGRRLPVLGVLDPRDGTVLGHLLPADERGEFATAWPDVSGFLDYAVSTAVLRDQPASATMNVYRDAVGFHHVDIEDLTGASGEPLPDGSWIAVKVDAGRVSKPGGVFSDGAMLFPVAGGAVRGILYDPPFGGRPPGSDATLTVLGTCGASSGAAPRPAGETILSYRLAEPFPRTLLYDASFGAPTSSATCGPATAFAAGLRLTFDRNETTIDVSLPVAGGPVLRGTYNTAERAFVAKGDVDGTYWLLDARLSDASGTRIEGRLTVTVTGSECNRTDHRALEGLLTGSAGVDPSAQTSSPDDQRARRS